MPPRKQVHIRYPKSRTRVIFSRTAMASQDTTPPSPQPPPPPAPTAQLESLFESSLRFEELPSNSPSPAPPSSGQPYSYYPYNPGNPYIPPPPAMPLAPPLFTTLPFLRDALVTPSSRDQDATASSCIRFLSYPEDPFPVLDRAAHIAFLEGGLDGDKTAKLPEYMVALDASRPWIIYWCLCGLASLGIDVKQRYRSRVAASLRPLQNRTGGFGGGNGQMSHMTATYSAILALAIVGGPIMDGSENSDEDEEDPLDIIDRLALLRFLHSVKMDTGEFRVALNGEADVRGVYCALTIVTLLQLPTAKGLLTGTREYLGRCQTYEGGFGATPAGNEAHGGYAFCALAALCMLGEPREVLSETLDIRALVSWLSARQYGPEGGLSGRTNKLVDGCYSTWVGGCWALVEAVLNGPQNEVPVGSSGELEPENKGVVGSLWSREGLARYILTCCQAMRGGLRDKPGRGPDFYHTCYVLLGLSSTQHYFYYITPSDTSDAATTAPSSVSSADSFSTAPESEDLPLTAAFLWRVSPRIPSVVKGVIEPVVEDLPTWPDDVAELGAEGDRLHAQHPLFNIPFECVSAVEAWVGGKIGV